VLLLVATFIIARGTIGAIRAIVATVIGWRTSVIGITVAIANGRLRRTSVLATIVRRREISGLRF
jgi:hypothetical protein